MRKKAQKKKSKGERESKIQQRKRNNCKSVKSAKARRESQSRHARRDKVRGEGV